MRFLLQIALFLMALSALDAKLTAEENQKRLDECGKEVPVIFIEFTSNLIGVTPISPLHILTTAFDLISFNEYNNKSTWKHDDSEFKRDCKDGKMYFEVPSEALKEIQLTTLKNYNDREYDKFDNPIKGYLIGFCSPLTSGEYGTFPLILEVAEELGVSYPCLGNVDVNVGDTVMLIDVSGDEPYRHSINGSATIQSIEENKYITTNDIMPNGRPTNEFKKYDGELITGSLIINSDNKWVVFGSIYNDEKLFSNQLYPASRLPKFLNTICDATGICDLPPTTPSPLPTIQPKKTDAKEIKNEENGNHMRRVELIIVLIMVILWILFHE